MTETEILKLIQIALSKEGARLFRNNNGALKDHRGQWVTYGLCPGSADLIGWTKEGRFLAVEVKTPDPRSKPTPQQEQFLEVVRRHGGVAFIARSEEEAVSKLREATDNIHYFKA